MIRDRIGYILSRPVRWDTGVAGRSVSELIRAAGGEEFLPLFVSLLEGLVRDEAQVLARSTETAEGLAAAAPGKENAARDPGSGFSGWLLQRIELDLVRTEQEFCLASGPFKAGSTVVDARWTGRMDPLVLTVLVPEDSEQIVTRSFVALAPDPGPAEVRNTSFCGPGRLIFVSSLGLGWYLFELFEVK